MRLRAEAERLVQADTERAKKEATAAADARVREREQATTEARESIAAAEMRRSPRKAKADADQM